MSILLERQVLHLGYQSVWQARQCCSRWRQHKGPIPPQMTSGAWQASTMELVLPQLNLPLLLLLLLQRPVQHCPGGAPRADLVPQPTSIYCEPTRVSQQPPRQKQHSSRASRKNVCMWRPYGLASSRQTLSLLSSTDVPAGICVCTHHRPCIALATRVCTVATFVQPTAGHTLLEMVLGHAQFPSLPLTPPPSSTPSSTSPLHFWSLCSPGWHLTVHGSIMLDQSSKQHVA